MSLPDLRWAACQALLLCEPAAKVAATRRLWDACASHGLDTTARLTPPGGVPLPGRPARPLCVPPQQVPMRSPFTLAGRVALLHAIAHIEFNAINLALDAVWRYPDLPAAYYLDWVQVASEEALHFSLLQAHLGSLGHSYGDFNAHNGLWEMAQRTADDLSARMALVPRILEARGLDVTPGMQAKFAQAGDARAVEILGIILRDEIGHVAVGNRWYRWCCARDGLDPQSHGEHMARQHRAPKVRPPLNEQARLAAGFTPEELRAWTHDASRIA